MITVDHLRIAAGVINKYRQGDSIPDEELIISIPVLESVSNFLKLAGIRYKLVSDDISRILRELESFRDSRGINHKTVESSFISRRGAAVAWLFSDESRSLPAGEARKMIVEKFGVDVEQYLQNKFSSSL